MWAHCAELLSSTNDSEALLGIETNKLLKDLGYIYGTNDSEALLGIETNGIRALWTLTTGHQRL